VAAVMTREPFTAAPDEPLLDAAARMSERRVRHLPVVDAEGRVLGVLSDRDVRTALGGIARGADRLVPPRLQLLEVAAAMTRGPITARPETPLMDVAAIFVDHRIGALPVVDAERRLLGIVSYIDVLARLAGREPQP
jgi:acetoin utilization protein AcuB